ncbi:nucleoporin Nup43 [Hyalella azteca]|uniref:Nucleoporin Nup43 n=1 Tax=Hyalella azteca TaxID=294128 RepID=A0A8B7NAG1_HYAAZ|nr:nucleoporin Nup43 [Hyalella azteca]
MPNSSSITKSYVYSKINSVRWKPSASTFSKPEIFISGSWDNEDNKVCVWRCASEGDPQLLQEISHAGDVSDITYISRDTAAVASSNGSVSLYKHADDTNKNLSLSQCFKHAHHFQSGSQAPCTSVASDGCLIATVGEDARLLLLSPGQHEPHRIIDSGSDSSEYAVTFIKTNEVLTGSLQGHLRLWDIRKAGNIPTVTMITTDQEWIRDVSCHPSQQHVVAAAGEAGALTLWDMRNTTQPFTSISAHSAPVLEARFHRNSPDHIFTCGLDGQLVHWDVSYHSARSLLEGTGGGGLVTSWLHPSVARGDVTTTALINAGPLPLNSVDVQGDVAVAASDNEALFVLRNLVMC